MNKLLFFIERHKYGILTALLVHVFVFLYFQIATYEEKIIYEPWSFQGRNIEAPDDILEEELLEEIPMDEFEMAEMAENISSFVKSSNDDREEAKALNEKFTSYTGDTYENVKQFEQEVINNLQAGRKSNESATDKVQNQNDGVDKTETNSTTPSQNKASEKAVVGKTMVEYDLINRKPFNNNDWHVRNPGYTCGNVNGKVTVDIKVNQSGEVIYAKYDASRSSNADQCMIRQAEKYALLSKFNYSSNAPKNQNGSITYLFVFRR